jgi:hypothetical protein
MTNQELEKKLEDLNTSIDKLIEERHAIQSMIADNNKRDYVEHYCKWSPKIGDYYVLFSNNNHGYHWCIAKLLLITDVDEEHMFFDTITSSYHEADYEYWCKTEANRIHFSNLEELESDFTIYQLDAPQAVILQHKMNTLAITYCNYKQVEESFKDVYIRKIS